MIAKASSLLVSMFLALAIGFLFHQKPTLKQQIDNEKACLNDKILKFGLIKDTINDTISVR